MKSTFIKSVVFGVFMMHGLSACAEKTNTTTKSQVSPTDKVALEKTLNGSAEKTLKADIDGDKKQDTVFFVLKSKFSKVSALKDLEIIQPFYDESKKAPNINSGSKHFFYCILTSKDEPFVVQDGNEISVLDTEAAAAVVTIAKKELNQILSEYNTESVGDGIILPTEAGIDLYLIWDGKSISLVEPIEMP